MNASIQFDFFWMKYTKLHDILLILKQISIEDFDSFYGRINRLSRRPEKSRQPANRHHPAQRVHAIRLQLNLA